MQWWALPPGRDSKGKGKARESSPLRREEKVRTPCDHLEPQAYNLW